MIIIHYYTLTNVNIINISLNNYYTIITKHYYDDDKMINID